MHIHKCKKLIRAGLYAAIISCAAGAAAGTYAWYAYQKDVEVDFVGTTVKASTEIQVGLRSDSPLLALEQEYRLGEITREDNVQVSASDPNRYVIYWVRGNYLSEILKSFQREINSAQGILNPITAGKYKAGWAEDTESHTEAPNTWTGFKNTPTTKPGEWKFENFITDKANYFYLPLVFRVINNERQADGSPIYLGDQEVFLTSFITEDLNYKDGNEVDLAKAVRCKVDYPAEGNTYKNYIFDPNSTTNAELQVGGILNLDYDRFYDSSMLKEIAYGEWENEPVYATEPVSIDEEIHYDDCTTFHANHQVGVYPIDMTQSHPSTCEVRSRDYAINASYTPGKGIVKTDTFTKYGYVDLSIYLEGWDSNIDNPNANEYGPKSALGHTFSVDLEFSLTQD